ncbi:hypothetical protein SAMN04488020_108158 [Palleronia marisminoris]|uniref:Uncharacterized protein n=1 Tax=Palleronia marisminoris TaxID=315423 RepID=A0A1Y5TC77_9RHOB|nr:hypothetical protein [Palleronia marisminoris]SFH23865.1 hypothetical protein SAMN04488020_108158 [Palleronia marisminoris]SLN58571.1 hypothetical protein PAM7066_02866 [Palleronia marisminoris]
MPHRVFALILAFVILAAGATVWLSTSFGATAAGALALPALVAWGLLRFVTARDARR